MPPKNRKNRKLSDLFGTASADNSVPSTPIATELPELQRKPETSTEPLPPTPSKDKTQDGVDTSATRSTSQANSEAAQPIPAPEATSATDPPKPEQETSNGDQATPAVIGDQDPVTENATKDEGSLSTPRPTPIPIKDPEPVATFPTSPLPTEPSSISPNEKTVPIPTQEPTPTPTPNSTTSFFFSSIRGAIPTPFAQAEATVPLTPPSTAPSTFSRALPTPPATAALEPKVEQELTPENLVTPSSPTKVKKSNTSSFNKTKQPASSSPSSPTKPKGNRPASVAKSTPLPPVPSSTTPATARSSVVSPEPEPSSYATAPTTRSSSPSTIRQIAMHDIVKHTATVDWYVKVPLNAEGLPIAFDTTTPLSSNLSIGEASNGSVSFKSEPGSESEEPTAVITIDSPVRLDLKIYSTSKSSCPIIGRYVDGYKEKSSTMIITWEELKLLVVEGGKESLDLLINITISDAAEPLPSDPVITETCSPASIEALGGFLDQPGGHDVVFQFPKHAGYLYGDRYILQRASSYFRGRLQSPTERQSSVSTNSSISSGPRKKLDEDSDDELEAEDSPAGHDQDPNINGSHGSATPTPSKRGRIHTPPNLHQIPSQNGMSTPMSTQSQIEFHGMMTPGFRLEPAQHPPYNVGVFVTQTNEISYRTFRAVLYYIYTGYIAFAPITSSIPVPLGVDEHGGTGKEAQEIKRNEREKMVKTYIKRYPNRPEPVSPKSVYVAARKYGLPALEAHALARLQVDMTPAVTVIELFSPFTRAHQNIRDEQLEKVVAVWSNVQNTKEWQNVRTEAKKSPDAYFMEALFDIIDKVSSSAGAK